MTERKRIGYIDALEADMVVENAYELCGLDRNGLLCLNVLLMEAYAATIATSLGLVYDPTYDPEAGQNWFERHIYAVIGGIKILGGLVALIFNPSIGIYLIISGSIDVIGEIIGEQLVGAAGQIVLGLQLVIKGAKLLNGCTISGIIDMLLGAGSMAFGSAEAQEAFGAGNWIKDLGINDGWYTGLMLATNVAATAANVIGPKCFAEGTLVACLSADGKEIHKPIEEIEVGDRVLAYDEETGKQGYKLVVRLFRNQTREWYHVFIDGEEIKCTGGHPFYVEGKGFIPAKELKSGDKCLLSTGKDVTIEKVEVEKLTEAETTYNFEVADFHTYYVTEKDVLVHNKCFTGDQQAVIDLAKEAKKAGGITKNNAETLVGWAQEYGIKAHMPMIHPNRSGIWSYTLHINIFNMRLLNLARTPLNSNNH